MDKSLGKNEEAILEITRRKHTFVPDEAPRIAREFRSAAGRIREQAREMKGIQSNLQGAWEGNSAERFMDEFEPQIKEMEHFAEWLDDKAHQIERMTVTVWETVSD